VAIESASGNEDRGFESGRGVGMVGRFIATSLKGRGFECRVGSVAENTGL
jgi:hypothetical protein